MWSSNLQKWSGTILKHILGRCFTKKPPFGTQKMKNDLFSNKVGNFLVQHCLPCQDVHVCTIWPHSGKLCHGCGHNMVICLESH